MSRPSGLSERLRSPGPVRIVGRPFEAGDAFLPALSGAPGWHDVAQAVRPRFAAERYGALLVDTREMAAEMLYYLRDSGVPLYIWAPGPEPRDHYQMTRPLPALAPEAILFVSLRPCRPEITNAFTGVQPLGAEPVPLVETRTRSVYLCRLAGYKGAETKAR